MLKKNSQLPEIKGPVLIVIMDGIGANPNAEGNAVTQARTPVLDKLLATRPHVLIKAHGTAVGMPSDDDMGNSEVGHNAIGAGRVFRQGAALVNEAIASGGIFRGDAWRELIGNTLSHGSTLHLLGLFSDGNVHSHMDHLQALIRQAAQEGQRRVRVHILLDGRDVPETSALEYVEPFERFLDEVRGPDFDVRIASGGGRMNITMDRYEANWGMVEKGWHTHVLGEGRYFDSVTQAIQTLREESPGVSDQDLPPFVIAENGEPVGPILDHDSVIFFNFRGDRAIEITRAFEDEDFTAFDRVRRPDVVYAGMLQYDGDLKLPARYLVAPPAIDNTMGELLAAAGVTQLAISETQKYGHVTYFWNGNRSGKFNAELETYVEIPSDVVPFEQKPRMKADEIADELIRLLDTGRYRSARVNFANGDMVGHTGRFDAAVQGVEAVDQALGRVLAEVDKLQGAAIVTADHGNAEEMYELDKRTGKPVPAEGGGFKSKTAHTLNPVPCILYVSEGNEPIGLREDKSFGLSNLAATTVNLLGFEAPAIWDESMLKLG